MKILVAEDDKISSLKLVNMLNKWGYEPVACSDGQEAWEVVQQEDCPKLMILDWMMPGMNGVELCRKIREKEQDGYAYILLLTSKQESEDLIEGMEAGADDYITKPFNPHELKVRLRAGSRILNLTNDLIEARNQLHKMATHDALTEVLNRYAIMNALYLEIDRSSREGSDLSIALMDIDFFKKVNDVYGHNVGDEVLKEVSKRLRNVVRPYDNVGRYGGEEFLVILPGCNEEGAILQSERLRKCLSDTPMETEKGPLDVTASFGVCTVKGKKVDAKEFIGEADKVLYQAKENGRNRIEHIHF